MVDLHGFLEAWLKGDVPNTGAALARLADALAEDFTVIHPSGRREGKVAVIRNFAEAYGNRPKDYRLEIGDISLRRLGHDLCLVTYKETHAGHPASTRISTSLLKQRPDAANIEWLFLQETRAPDATPESKNGVGDKR